MAKGRPKKVPVPPMTETEQAVQLREQVIKEFRKAVRQRDKLIRDNKIYFFNSGVPGLTPNPKQELLLNAWDSPQYKVFTFTGGNRSGKTTLLTIIAYATMFGGWPWEKWKRFDFPHKEPRRIRIVGQGWETHIKTVVLPALEEWWPKERRVGKKKNNQGVEYFWTDMNTGSTIEIMSNNQEADVFEGWSGDLVCYDEPPSRDIRVACARGLIDRRGRELFCATLLKEAWISREVVKAVTADGRPDLSVFNVVATTYDNVGFGLTEEGIRQFEKTLKPHERDARLRGIPAYLSTLVCPAFDRHKHIVQRMPVPLDWIIDIQIDFHPSKPWAAVFLATARNGFKYVVDELRMHGNPKAFAEEVVRVIKRRQYERVNSIEIDPLAKGGENNDIDVFSMVGSTLAPFGYALGVASKNKESGIAILNNLLWTENQMPGLFFFHDCTNTISQVENWMVDPDTLKPSKDEDDFCECLYRLCLKNTKWFDPSIVNVSKQKNVML